MCWITHGFTALWKRLEIHTVWYILLLLVRQNKRLDFCSPNNSYRYNASHFREHDVAGLIAMVSNCQTWENGICIGTPDTYLVSNMHYIVWLGSHSKTEFTWPLAACVTTNKACNHWNRHVQTYLLSLLHTALMLQREQEKSKSNKE